MAGWQSGSCRGLQILVHRFDSGTGLQIRYRILFRLSSAVEQSAVNRLVACSNQAAGANKKTPTRGVFLLAFVGFRFIVKVGGKGKKYYSVLNNHSSTFRRFIPLFSPEPKSNDNKNFG